MRHITIQGLMVFVLTCGVGMTALNASTSMWDSIVFSSTLLIFTASILTAVYGGGHRRASWLGFSLFGWIYLVSSLVPSVEYRLLTTKGLSYLDAKTANRQGMPIAIASSHEGHTLFGWDEGPVRIWATATGKPIPSPSGTIANFRRIGHCLIALFAGFVGAVIARRLERGRVVGTGEAP